MFADDSVSRTDAAGNQQAQVPRRRQSKLGGGLASELPGINIDRIKLERVEIQVILSHFKRHEKPIIQFIDLLNIIKKISMEVNAKMKEFILKEIEARNIKKIDIESVLLIIAQVKEEIQRIEEENTVNAFNEYVDVFVALGGNADQSGHVPKSTILGIIKSEFELTYDMEVFLEKIETRGELLDFPTFCMLFEGGMGDERQLQKSSSVLSLLSNRSKRSVKSNKSLKVKYRDFEKFYAQMESAEKQHQADRDHDIDQAYQQQNSQNENDIPPSP